MNTIIAQLDAAIAQLHPADAPYITVSDGNITYRLKPDPVRLARFKVAYIAACKPPRKRGLAKPWHLRAIPKLSDDERAKLLNKLSAEGY